MGLFPGAKVIIKTIFRTMNEDKNINKKGNCGVMQDNLPKARAGHPYMTFLGENLLASHPSVDHVLKEIGLHYFPKKNQITGIPKKSGSFDLLFNNREYNESGMEELSTQKMRLIVEEDFDYTIEHADENDPYWKPDDDVCTISANQNNKKPLKKDIAAASKRGYHQIEKGKIREDDFCIRYDQKTRWYVLAVADGAGKSQFSRRSSKVACNSVVDACLKQLTAQSKSLKKLAIRYSRKKTNHVRGEILGKLHDIIALSVMEAYKDIVVEAATLDRQPIDYATTLLMCICKKFEFGWLVGAFAVGDGAICVYQKDNWYANLMSGDNSSSEKCFLTTPGIITPPEMERRIRFTIIDDFSALFLMTNGVSNPKFGSEADLPCFELWDRFWNDISSQVDFSGKINDVGEDLLKWLDFWTPGKHDDRTIAMIF